MTAHDMAKKSRAERSALTFDASAEAWSLLLLSMTASKTVTGRPSALPEVYVRTI